MASYELVFKQSVAKDLRPIPKKDLARILRRLESLRDDPRPPGSEKLSGRERYWIRQGVYLPSFSRHNECYRRGCLIPKHMTPFKGRN